MVSGLTFRSLIHFEFIFVYGVRECSDVILIHVVVQFSQHHLLKRLFFSIVYSCLHCCRFIDHECVGLFLNSQWKKETHFNKWCWGNWIFTYKRMKLEHSQTSCTKRNSKWIKDLNVRPDTIRLLEENIGRTLFDINCRNVFFGSIS